MIVNSFLRDARESSVKLLVIAVVVAAAVAMGQLIAAGQVRVKTLIVILAGLVVILLVIRGSDWALRRGYLLAIMTFAVGHRSLYVGQISFFVPAELIAWILFFWLLVRTAREHSWTGLQLPKSLVFLIAWCLLSLAWTPNVVQRWDDVLSMLKLWVIAMPIFIVTTAFVTETAHLRQVLRILLVVALYMSVLAIVEYGFPNLASIFPWLFDLRFTVFETPEGFVRSYFKFFGNSIGVIIVGWGMLAAIDELIHGNRLSWRIIALGVLIAGLGAVYVAGQRATWISLPIGIAVFVLLSGHRSLGVLILLFALLLLLPSSFWQRFESVLPSSHYFAADKSLQWRVNRYQWAIGQFSASPLLGIGLGGGLTHNEFLAFAVHAGLPAAIAFTILMTQILGRLRRLYDRTSSVELRRFSCLFLAMFVTWLVDLNFHPVLGVATIAVPYWFMLALAWHLPNLSQKKPDLSARDPRAPLVVAPGLES